ncbi:malonyl-ACP O-methyltransferase BioC [Psychromonas sp.]|uniref:malonyl-ACP O-methyltransferase BioC n=1 Tax=Psychromonas sp. TaxID=1884585 RepID=UPI0035626E96
MTNSLIFDIDKAAVAQSFSKAAAHYDQFAQLQRDIGDKLFASLNKKQTANCLDLGCGTGYFSEKLLTQHNIDSLICFDLSAGMLAFLQNNRNLPVNCVQGDMDCLPFSDNQFSCIFSNLAMQWSSDLQNVLRQLKGVLLAGGELNFSTLLAGSLIELRDAWQEVDVHPHTNTFLTLVNIEKMLEKVGFTSVNIHQETITLYYPNVCAVMRDLKGIGANQVHGHQRHKLQGRSLINKLEQGYAKHKTRSGLLPLSYQVCYIKAVK